MKARDAVGRLMRRLGLHRLSGWWDAGTDIKARHASERARRAHIRDDEEPEPRAWNRR